MFSTRFCAEGDGKAGKAAAIAFCNWPLMNGFGRECAPGADGGGAFFH
jgi:hypothetical protein